MEKVANFTQFEQKNTHISGCKIVHLYIISTVTVHIYTVIVACAFNILLVFSLSYLCSHSHSHLTLSLSLLSPHLTPPFPHLLSLSPLPSVKLCLHYRRSSNPHSHLSPFFPSFITFLPILFVNIGILRFWSDLAREYGVVFVGVDFDESWKRLRSTFVATTEENQPLEPTEVARR